MIFHCIKQNSCDISISKQRLRDIVKLHLGNFLLTISSGDRIPNCTRFTVRSVALESLIAIVTGNVSKLLVNKHQKIHNHNYFAAN